MVNVFKLLIAAIGTIAIIALLAVLLGVFKEPLDVKKEITSGLNASELDLGKTIKRKFDFQENSRISISNFDTKSRTVNIRCINESSCCQKKEKCGKIEWDDREVFFPKKIITEANFRCVEINELNACSVFIGGLPPQIKIINDPKEISFKHDSQKLEFTYDVINSGEKPIVNEITGNLKVFKINSENLKKEEIYSIPNKVLNEVAKNYVLPDQKIKSNWSIPSEYLNADGAYEIKVNEKSIDAGFDEKIIKLSISNSPGLKCEINQSKTNSSIPEIINGKCSKKLYCNTCELSVLCSETWKEKLGHKEVLSEEKSFALQILGEELCK